jgi:hypothetical protein
MKQLNLGVLGAGLATILALLVGFMINISATKKLCKSLTSEKKKLHVTKTEMSETLKLALPCMLQQFIMYLSSVAIQPTVNSFGDSSIAAYSIALKIYDICTIFFFSTSRGLSVFCSQCLGNKKIHLIKKGMLSTILITVAVRRINETKENAKNTMIESIELAAENYVIDFNDELLELNKNDYMYITLQTLIENNYFTENLIDPTTKKSLPLSNLVYITREPNGKINSYYDENQRESSKIRLIGKYNVYIKLGDNYEDSGVTAELKDGTDVTDNVEKTENIDLTKPGTYKVTYSLGDVKISRNVIIYK